MNDNEIKNAFDHIEPEAGAQARMYANILKKAAEQEGKAGETAPAEARPAGKARQSRPAWQRWGSLAACLAVILAVGFALPRMGQPGEGSEPPVMGGSPYEDVTGPGDFEKLGFTIDAPAGASDVFYCIFDGEIARVDFTLDGHAYTYEAAQLDGNFSRAEGEAVGSTALNAAYNAVLDRLSPDTWRAHWTRNGVSCYLTNFDGAEEEAITTVADTLMEDS